MICRLILGLAALLQDDQPPTFREKDAEFRIDLKADVWFASVEGSGRLNRWFGTEREEKTSPRFSFDREGRLGATEAAPGVELHALWEHSLGQALGFRIRYRWGAWSESGTVDAPFTVDGTTVPAGTAFRSRYRMDEGAIGVLGRLTPSGFPLEARVWMGCLFHQQRFEMATSPGSLTDRGGGLNAELGGRVEYRFLPFLVASGELSASIGFGAPDAQAVFGAGVVWEGIRLEAGYRHRWVSWGEGPNLHLSMGGPFVGASVRF